MSTNPVHLNTILPRKSHHVGLSELISIRKKIYEDLNLQVAFTIQSQNDAAKVQSTFGKNQKT